MTIQFDKAKWQQDNEGTWLLIRVMFPQKVKEFVSQMKNKLYDADLKEHREKRSLDSNAYAWVLMDKIASYMETTKDEVYLTMLERYGVCTYIVVREAATAMFMKEYKLCKDMGEITVNGTTGHQMQVYFGSSQYDTKQMARLIDGIVSEAKEMGIETKTPQELAMMKDEWGK